MSLTRKVLTFILILSGIGASAQEAEVLMLPLTGGPLAPMASQLTQRLQDELLKLGITVNFVPRSIKLPLSATDKAELLKNARTQKLSFLLIQQPDTQDPSTLRHDLIRTFDEKPLAAILVKGNSGTSGLLKAAILAKEIRSQLEALPPEVRKANLSVSPPADKTTGDPSSVPQKDTIPFCLEALAYPYFPIGPAAGYLTTGLGYNINARWILIQGIVEFGLGPAISFFTQEAKGPSTVLPLFFTALAADFQLSWKVSDWFSLIADSDLSAVLLTFDVPGEGLKNKLLPGFEGGVGGIFYLPENFYIKSTYHFSAIMDFTLPLLFHKISIGLGYRL